MNALHNKTRLAGTALLAAALVAGAAGCSRSSGARAGEDGKPIPVKVYPVEEQVVRRQVEAVGSLYAWEETTVSAEVEGRVDRVLVDVGDMVEEGAPLVTLSRVELEYEAERQRAAVAQVRARLGLGPGDSLPRDPKQVPFVQRAAAELLDAEQKFRRAEELSGSQLISQAQLDEAATRHQSARAAYDEALQTVEQLKAQLASSEAAQKLAEKKLADATIRAPFRGAIKERRVSPGEYLRVQSPVVVLVRTDQLRARLNVPEKWAGALTLGSPVSVQVEAYPNEVFRGELTRLNPAVSPETRSFEAEALLANPGGRLKPGFFVQASLPTNREETVLTLPEAAVNYRHGTYKVFVVKGTQVEEREIKPGAMESGRVEIVGGLTAGNRVAVAASGVLYDGAAITESAP